MDVHLDLRNQGSYCYKICWILIYFSSKNLCRIIFTLIRKHPPNYSYLIHTHTKSDCYQPTLSGLAIYTYPFIGWVVAESVVIQPCFTILILPLIAERTITSKNAYCKITFFSLEKVIFRWQNPKNTRQCSVKGGEKKAEKNSLIEAGY